MTLRATSPFYATLALTSTPQSVVTGGKRKGRRLLLLGLAVCGLSAALPAQSPTFGDDVPSGASSEAVLTPAEGRMKADVGFLAADAREGREPGTKGIEASAAYIAEVFKKAGLKGAPGADGYFQPFFISAGYYLKRNQSMAFDGPDGKTVELQFKNDFTPLAIGTAGNLEKTPIVFAGYGITAKKGPRNPGLDYDDYA